jgi:type IV pilus assembly protein PilM
MVLVRWKKFVRRFRRRIDTLVGIDFGNGAVKVAEVSLSGGKPYLKTFAIVELPAEARGGAADDPELAVEPAVLLDALERALALSGAKSKDAVLAVGGRMIFVREVSFPRLSPAELAEAVKWDLPKYVPYEADSYEFDYAVTGHDPAQDELKVLVVAAPKTALGQLTAIVRQAGLSPLAIDLEPLAVYRTMAEGANSILLDIGTVSSQIAFFQQGELVFTRMLAARGDLLSAALERAANDGTVDAELDEMLDELDQELQRTIQFFRQQNRELTVERVFVTGISALTDVVRLLQHRLDLPVVAHNPLSGLALNPSLSATHVNKLGPQLAVAVGLALRGDEP